MVMVSANLRFNEEFAENKCGSSDPCRKGVAFDRF